MQIFTKWLTTIYIIQMNASESTVIKQSTFFEFKLL